MSKPSALKYRAFLSYSHVDRGWASWLHKRLEDYRFEKDLVGRTTAMGPIPRTLRPIFRDREDFSGGHTLTEATVAALDASAALIVLCSTVAATRPAVNEEVRLFKSRHPLRSVVPVIVEGTPYENFPPALRYELEPDGTVSTRPVTVLAPDLREEGDGRSLALAKVIAGLTGVGTDDIVRRAERDHRRRLRNWVAGLSTVIVVLAGLTVWAEINRRDAVEQRHLADQRRQEAERNFALAKGAADGLVFDIAKGLRDVEGMRASALSRVLGTAQKTFDGLTEAVPNNLQLQESRAAMLTEFGDTYRTQGNLAAALKSHQGSLAIRQRLVGIEPQNVDWRRDLGVAYEKVGHAQLDQGELPAALESYQASLQVLEELAKLDPGNASWQRELSVTNDRIGDLLVAEDNLPAALNRFDTSLSIMTHLTTLDPQNAGWKRELGWTQIKQGDLLRKQSKNQEALTRYRNALEIFEHLDQSDPDNSNWLRDYAIAHERIGMVLDDERDLPNSLESFKRQLAILGRLAKSDPGNTGWQYNLSLSYAHIGGVLWDQDDLLAALENYNAARAIQETLTKSDPNNAEWQRNLAITYYNVAELRAKQGARAEAIAIYQRARDIIIKLKARSPDIAELDHSLALYERRLAELQNEHATSSISSRISPQQLQPARDVGGTRRARRTRR
jgi:tetratricopeptide (TPR) repeat protein